MDFVASLKGALAESGYRILEQDEPAIQTAADGIADPFLNNSLTAVADQLKSAGGIKSFEWTPVANAVIDAEPGIDDGVNAQIKNLIQVVETALKNAAPLTTGG